MRHRSPGSGSGCCRSIVKAQTAIKWRFQTYAGAARILSDPAGLAVPEGVYLEAPPSYVVLAPEHRPQSPDRYRVRLYDEWVSGGWRRAIALLDETANPPLVVPYYRVDEGPR